MNKERKATLNVTVVYRKFISTEVYRCHKIKNYTLVFASNVFLSERRNFANNKINI